ncbi:hypothetical protein PPBDW_I21644 [Photobacterium kishitanii]|nr:hypothetical protein PPBDW_I21644 [Photobacterium kishitanii]
MRVRSINREILRMGMKNGVSCFSKEGLLTIKLQNDGVLLL